jgi:tight adherence protein B
MSDISIVFLLTFLAATLTIYGAYWFFVFNRRGQKIINRRLELSKSLANASDVLEALRQERGFSNFSNPTLRQLSDWLTQTGLRVEHRTLGLIFLTVFLALVVILSTLLGFGLIPLLLGFLTTTGVIFLALNRQRRRRIASFGEQMPDAIDVITRGVRVGLPFPNAVALVAREMPDPVGTEFGMLGDEIAFGLDVRSALENLARRVGQEDLLFLTIAVSIQIQTGGNLGEVLTRLSKLMRSRINMRLKISALSAEGRLSAVVLTALPFVLFMAINFIAPNYYGSVRGNPIVQPAIYIGLFLLLAGNVMMHRMVNFKY